MKKILSGILIILVTVLATGAYVLSPKVAIAASLTSMSDTMTRQKASTASDHTILLTTPTGVAEGTTVTVVFPADFDLTTIVEDDVDIADDGVELTTAANCAGSEKASAAVASQTLTFTICAGDGGAIAGGSVIRIKIGTVATSSGTGTHQIVNATTAGSKTITLTASTDTGTMAVPITGGSAADDQVVITATVAPSITFTNDDAAIGFGTLSTSAAQYATANAAGSSSDSVANTLVIVTNAASGYTLTYNGATLTSGGNTITPITAGITDDANGTPGSEQFGISGAMTGTGSMTAGYDNAGTADWKFVAGSAQSLASHTAPTASDSIAMHYLANIAGTTETGSYTTTLTFIATANY